MNILSRGKQFLRNICGSSLLEFAFILPVFLLLICAVVEFGWYFVRYDGLSRALSVTVAELQISGGIASTSQSVVNGNGSGIIPFGTANNYICAQAFQNNPNPTNTNPPPVYCANGTWAFGTANVICSDTGVACVAPYWAGIVAHADTNALTGLVNTVLPKGTAITQTMALQVGTYSSGSSGSGGGSGSWCGNYVKADCGGSGGSYDNIGTAVNSNCQGVSIATTCPAGYTRQEYSQDVEGSGRVNACYYTCVQN